MANFIKRLVKKLVLKYAYKIIKELPPSPQFLTMCDEINEKLTSLQNCIEQFSNIHFHKDIDQHLYDRWFLMNVKNSPLSPYWQYFSTTFQYDTPYGKLVYEGMYKAEFMYEKTLLAEIKEKNIEGVIVEFGVSGGWRLKQLVDSMKEVQLERDVYGFDSFEGLPKPDYTYDSEFWKEGMYAADINDVKQYLKCSENPHIKLIKGWFSDIFKKDEVKNLEKIAFARIDCDLYHPAIECLDYLKERIVDNGILVFDDWSNNLRIGETKAFYEWLPNSGWEFDFLLLNGWVHLFLRARKKRENEPENKVINDFT